MENKSNFKVTLKGARVIDGKTEMINKDYAGQLVLVITLRENDEGINSEAGIVGGVHADVPVLLLKAIRSLLGERNYATACAVVALEGLVKNLDAETDAAEAEKAAEELVNGEAGDDE